MTITKKWTWFFFSSIVYLFLLGFFAGHSSSWAYISFVQREQKKKSHKEKQKQTEKKGSTISKRENI